MAFSSYSTTPANNTSLNGINIAENCPAANVNNALRQIAADGAELAAEVTAIDVSNYMPVTGGNFSGAIGIAAAGNFLYHATPGRFGPVFIQPLASALPSAPPEGTIVFQY